MISSAFVFLETYLTLDISGWAYVLPVFTDLAIISNIAKHEEN